MTISYFKALRLVWGVIEVGALSYCPGQTVHKHNDCERNYCEAQCIVTAVSTDYPYRVTLERIKP